MPPRPSSLFTRYLPMYCPPPIGGGVGIITGIGGGGVDADGTGISRIVAATSWTSGNVDDGAGGWPASGPGAGGCTAGRGASSEADSWEVGAHGGTPGACELGGVPGG